MPSLPKMPVRKKVMATMSVIVLRSFNTMSRPVWALTCFRDCGTPIFSSVPRNATSSETRHVAEYRAATIT